MLKSKNKGLSDLKNRLLFLLMVLIVYRIGAHIPVPGLDPNKLSAFFSHSSGGLLNLLNMFSGGALLKLTVFALGIMPYISASIIMQLFASISPKLEQLKKEGEIGKRKINTYTRYATLILATFQAVGMAKLLSSQGIALYSGFSFYFITSISLVAGTVFLMWLGEQATEKGIGNGISMIIFASIVSRLPSAFYQLVQQVKEGELEIITLLVVVILILSITAFVIFVERAQRRISVNYAQRNQMSRSVSAPRTDLPLKINMAGVIPPIFASSIIVLPATIFKFFGSGDGFFSNLLGDVSLALSPGQPLYNILFSAAIVFFAFFYAALVFNPKDTADNLKKSGAFLPGIRPGEQTALYIDGVMTRLTLIGALYLVFVCLIPELFIYLIHVPVYFGGTSLLIVVVVIMDFIAQIQSHLLSQQYQSLLKKSPVKM